MSIRKLVTVVIWQINGERCPMANGVDGNGGFMLYNLKDGTEVRPVLVKDGKVIVN